MFKAARERFAWATDHAAGNLSIGTLPKPIHIHSSRRLPSVRPKSTAAYSVATPAKKRL
jgi:hypothetical protein